MLLGQPLSEDLVDLSSQEADAADGGDVDESALAQHVKHLIDDCKVLLVPDAETILGAWGLIDADPT